jgi:probable HAF family extracellular repeat protein
MKSTFPTDPVPLRERFALFVISLALSAPGANAQPIYTFTPIEPPGASQTQALGINNAGTVVGYFDSASGRQGFLYKNGVYTTIQVPIGTETIAHGINDAEDIVGSFRSSSGNRRSFRLSGSTFTYYDFPGALQTQFWAINNNGTIVGNYESSPGISHGLVFNGISMVTLDVPGAGYTQAVGINDSDVISGFHYQFVSPIVVKGFTLSAGTFFPVEFPSRNTYAHKINNGGVVVGFLESPSEGFSWQSGTFSTYTVPGAVETYAIGNNDLGQIAGAFREVSGGILRGYIASPGASYHICLLYDPSKAKKSGSTIPIKLRLCDQSGSNLSTSSITLQAVTVRKVSDATTSGVEDAGNANPDSYFRYDSNLQGYIFNLQTTGLTGGSYTLDFKAGSDAVVYKAPFQVR